jgi:probable rRNA maturation factor
MSIAFTELKRTGLNNRSKLKKYIIRIGKLEGIAIESIHIIFCSDDYLLSINKDFLQHDYYTDIITFDLSEPGSSQKCAEIYISIDRVRSNAIDYQTTIKKELHRVIFHGILHLCGFKDKNNKQQQQMRLKEEEYLSDYFK